MSKDTFWFKHDSNASRDIKLLKIKHIYGFTGIGLYWTVIELLREQPNYKYPSDELSLQMMSGVIGSGFAEFMNWFTDAVKFELLVNKSGVFYSQSLINKMGVWEKRKQNGSKPKAKVRQKGSIREDEKKEEESKENEKFVPPSFDEFKNYFTENGFPEALAARVFKSYDVADWHKANGEKIKNWKQTCQQVWFTEEQRVFPGMTDREPEPSRFSAADIAKFNAT